jgi:hypothetical protein
MFTYGKDIPLDDAVSTEMLESAPPDAFEPSEFMFTYGRDIFTDDDVE